MILLDTDVIKLLEKPFNKENIARACTITEASVVHFTGENFQSLILQLVSFEDAAEYNAKRGLAEPVTMEQTKYIFQELTRWQNKPNTIRKADFGKDETSKNKFDKIFEKVWKGNSINYYTNKVLSKGLFTNFNDFVVIEQPAKIEGDPNNVIVEGLKKLKSTQPEYHLIQIPISAVKDFRKTGNTVEYIIFSYDKKEVDGKIIKRWRVIDENSDRIFIEDGAKFTIDLTEPILKYQTIPVTQIGSEFEIPTLSDVCISPIHHVIPLMNRFVKFDAMNLISETKTAYPHEWYTGKTCKHCEGSGIEIIEGNLQTVKCHVCDGQGMLPPLGNGKPMLIPFEVKGDATPVNATPGGKISFDIDAVKFQAERLKDRKEEIINAALNSRPVQQQSLLKESATSAVINVNPLQDRNSEITVMCERVETFIGTYIGKQISPNDFKSYVVTLPKTLNILDENILMSQIKEAKLNGASITFIQSLHKEMIFAKYRNDNNELKRQIALFDLEPCAGYTIEEVSAIPGVTNIDKVLKGNFTSFVDEYNKSGKSITDVYYNSGVEVAKAELIKLVTVRLADKSLSINMTNIIDLQAMQLIISDPNISDERKQGILKVVFSMSNEDIAIIFKDAKT